MAWFNTVILPSFSSFRTARRSSGGDGGLDWALFLSFVFAMVAVGGGLALIWAITTPQGIPKPLELTTQQELELQFNLKEEPTPPPPPDTGKQEDKGSGIKDPGAKDKKEQGGGKKIAGAEGKLGRNGKEDNTKPTGEIRAGLGGMSEALSSDVGDEVKKTLGTISSVADALGGLRSDQIVLGAGSGTGLKGTGNAGRRRSTRRRAVRLWNARHRLGPRQRRRLWLGLRWSRRTWSGRQRQGWPGRR